MTTANQTNQSTNDNYEYATAYVRDFNNISPDGMFAERVSSDSRAVTVLSQSGQIYYMDCTDLVDVDSELMADILAR